MRGAKDNIGDFELVLTKSTLFKKTESKNIQYKITTVKRGYVLGEADTIEAIVGIFHNYLRRFEGQIISNNGRGSISVATNQEVLDIVFNVKSRKFTDEELSRLRALKT